ncbi:related to Copper homeostasis protein CutC [Ramularia collo-cygni]|uniref:Copper homeostasis protein cutC homolog n=1 Tax=Ramularia collo-cygni TaxID=112498 RepID=A0A2D3UTC7_9PEZI|nr:related to Copper homeostasis protein CutC [Ramularia collo-cygni]CZT20732.1 related to Copper homeostasis protein CutC [Ramularia collo-cygni]
MLEVACFNVASAIVAAENHADRIELCEDQAAGGTTPSLDWLIQVKARVSIPVFVMIRPRGGDFVYTEAEFARMQEELQAFKQSADGFVFGILDSESKVDKSRTAELVRFVHPKPCTFHRAFDQTSDHYAALEDVITTGCKAILSSGGQPTALEGINVLGELVKKAGDRIVIIPGGSVRAANSARILQSTGAKVLHSSCCPSSTSSAITAELPDVAEVRGMVQSLQ